MNAPRYARIAARLLGKEEPASLEFTDASRSRATAQIAEALRAKARRRARVVWATGFAAAMAASALGYVGVRRLSPPSLVLAAQGISAVASPKGRGTAILSPTGTQPLHDAESLQQGGRLVAGDAGGATVRLSTGTELTVQENTSLQFESAGPVERFFLSRGVMLAKVTKLTRQQRFIVRTPDAEIEVRGTAFRVAIVEADAKCGGGTHTRVSVSEGIVEVRAEGATTSVHPGESWPGDCITSVPAPSDTVPAARVVSTKHPVTGADNARLVTEQTEQSPLKTSTIAEQNELFSRATAARRRGDSAAAIAAFDQLLIRFPESPLAESASVQRMNLLRTVDGSAARSAARQYLARYPRGYAKSDAEILLAQP